MLDTATGTTLSRTTLGTTVVSGLGFKPNLIIFWGTLRTADGTGPTNGFAHQHWSIATRRNDDDAEGWHCYGAWAQDNVATSNTGGQSHDDGRAIAILSDSTPVTVAASAQIDSWDTDGFTLDWDIVDSNAYIVNWYAIGGDEIVEVEGNLQGIQSGTVTYNLTWQPDVIFFLIGSSFAQSIWSFGMACGSDASQQACMFGINRDGVNPSQSAQSFVPGSVGGYYRIGAAIERDLLFNVSAVNSNGFETTVTDTAAASRVFLWVALKGGQHDVGFETVPAATGIQTIPVAVGSPQGVFFGAGLQATEDAEDAGISFGSMVRSGGSQASLFAAEDNTSPTVVDQYQGNEALIGGFNISGADPTSMADLEGFSGDEFSLDWTEVSGDEERFMWWVCGPVPGSWIPHIYRRVSG